MTRDTGWGQGQAGGLTSKSLPRTVSSVGAVKKTVSGWEGEWRESNS